MPDQPQPTTRIRTYRYRLRTTARDRRRLDRRLAEYRELHNAAVEERENHYAAKTAIPPGALPERAPSYQGQTVELTTFRRELLPDMPRTLARGALAQAARTYAAFFRRHRAGERPGRPRFLSKHRHDTLEFTTVEGMRVAVDRVQAKGIGSLKMHLHRPLPVGGELKAWKLTRELGAWFVCLTYELPPAAPRRPRGRTVGVDLGLEHLATDDAGGVEVNPRYRAAAEPAMRRAQRQLRWRRSKDGRPRRAMSRRGSRRRRKQVERLRRLHRKVANQRKTNARRAAARIVSRADRVVVEDLNVRGLARSRLSRAITDAGWSTLVEAIEDRAEGSGGCDVVRVDPRGTSQTCPGCGVVRRKGLQERRHRCPDCGLVLHRDHAAALIIKSRGSTVPRLAERGRRGRRASGKTGSPPAAAVPCARESAPGRLGRAGTGCPQLREGGVGTEGIVSVNERPHAVGLPREPNRRDRP